MTLTLDWDFFWRQSLDDGLDGNAIDPIVSGADSDERYVGSAPSVQVEWRVDPRVTFNAAYVRFFAGPFLEESGPGKDVDFVGARAALRFWGPAPARGPSPCDGFSPPHRIRSALAAARTSDGGPSE